MGYDLLSILSMKTKLRTLIFVFYYLLNYYM